MKGHRGFYNFCNFSWSGLFANISIFSKTCGRKCIVIDKRTSVDGNVCCELNESINANKCGVPIIEDLDRLDPVHLFRILNVLSAHIDYKSTTNKFGFTNIVAVLDYETAKHIFIHFYGEKANFDGYMSKFIGSHSKQC